MEFILIEPLEEYIKLIYDLIILIYLSNNLINHLQLAPLAVLPPPQLLQTREALSKLRQKGSILVQI